MISGIVKVQSQLQQSQTLLDFRVNDKTFQIWRISREPCQKLLKLQGFSEFSRESSSNMSKVSTMDVDLCFEWHDMTWNLKMRFSKLILQNIYFLKEFLICQIFYIISSYVYWEERDQSDQPKIARKGESDYRSQHKSVCLKTNNFPVDVGI